MQLATIRTGTATRAAIVDGDHVVELDAADVGQLLERDGWRSAAPSAGAAAHALGDVSFAPVVPRPEKIICVGLNYREHILEMGRELPAHPTLFAKYVPALIGAHDDVVLPAASASVDWEVELGVVIGAAVRHASESEAVAAIAGYTVVNDVSCRDWQYRTAQWLQGKTFESTTPLGPVLVVEETDGRPAFDVSCTVDGETMQQANTADLVFDPVTLIRYLSAIITLSPGDVIATGTPGGVGSARTPPRFLEDGTELVTRIEGIGECRNRCRREVARR